MRFLLLALAVSIGLPAVAEEKKVPTAEKAKAPSAEKAKAPAA